jgi:hypothetical protein
VKANAPSVEVPLPIRMGALFALTADFPNAVKNRHIMNPPSINNTVVIIK